MASWGKPLMDGKLSEMDPYEEVAQQVQAPPLSRVYVPNPMVLDEHVPVYVLEPEHSEYHVPSDDDMQVEDQLMLMTLHKPKDDDEDLEEDPEEDHTDYPANGGDGDDEPSNDDDDDDDTDDEDKEPTKDKDDDEEEEHLALADSSAVPVINLVPSPRDTKAFETGTHAEHAAAPTPPSPRARISVRPQAPMTASTQALIDAFTTGSPPFPLPPTSSTYDQAPLGHRTAMIRMRDDIPEEDMPPQRRFVLTAPYLGLIRSPGHDARTIARTADMAEDVGYVITLQASKRMMMTFIEKVNLRVSYQVHVRRQESEDFYIQLHDAQTDFRDIRLEIDVVRGQRTAYETELHKALKRNFTHTQDDESQSSGGGLRRPVQPARVCSYIDFVKCQPLNFKGTEGHNAAYAMTWRTLKKKMMDKYCLKGKIKKLKIKLWNLKVRGNDVAAYTQRFQELAFMCTKFLADETKKIDKYIGGLPNNIHGNVMHNDNKRKADDSSRNNQQPQPYKKQNVAKAYTVGPGEKKAYTGNLPLCTKCNYHHIGQCAPKCGNCKRQWKQPKGKSRLNIISCTKAHKYLSNGCDVFLAHITMKEAKDKSEGKKLEDVPIVRDFLEVFPEDLMGISPARQVEFQIDLVPGTAPVARAPYRLAPFEMKELAKQLQELSDKGFIGPSSSP
nr:putative reverse transcriptase domain-containing protein [Tanacetum cinerariifolium]